MAANDSPKAGARFLDWSLIEFLGRGGSGTVWKASDRSGRLGAIKFLYRRHKTDNKRYRRFKHEIEAMRACGDIDGVLPLLDFYAPERPDPKGEAWLVSAFATPLTEAIGQAEGFEAVVKLCAALAETLSVMHERGYSHRDIKPENIFLHQGVWCLGDFGLVDFPGKTALTSQGEKLGPIHYIAPEMLSDAARADGAPADVYSLGKLLWKLATGQRYPLPGTQRADEPALSISAYVDDGYAHTLDRLLEAATQVEPLQRPSMKDFAQALTLWLEPPPKPKGISDLTPFSKRVTALTGRFNQERKRRQDIQARADAERARVFDAFLPTLSEIRNALEKARIGRVSVDAPNGGNAHFYRAATGNQSAGTNDRTWFFQCSVNAALESEGKTALLMSGINLGIRNREDAKGYTLHDIRAPVLAAAGYIVRTRLHDGHRWVDSSRALWCDDGIFYFGQPSEEAIIRRFASGLRHKLRMAVERFIEAFEAAGS